MSNKEIIEELHEFLKSELEKAEISHQETLKRHLEIMEMIDKAMEK